MTLPSPYLKKKDFLTSAPILGYPDMKLDFVLDTDASVFCIGGVLTQIKDGQGQVIAFFSKSFKTRTQLLCHSHRAPCSG